MSIKNKYIAFILILGLHSNLFCQYEVGIHKVESDYYQKLYPKALSKKSSYKEIIPLNKSKVKNLSKTVYGYLPYWEYKNKKYLKFELLSHIALFSFSVDKEGFISNPPSSSWPWTDLITEAHKNGVKIHMTVINFEISKTEMHQVLTKREYINNFINSVKTKFFLFNLDGINIDFESSNIDVSDRGNVINTFMQELTDSVHSMSEDYEVTYASPAVNWGNRWDLVELAQSCDYLFIMGYPYYGNWSKVTGPTAPLIGGSINLTKTINTEYERINPDKLILGLPYYGSHWKIFGDSLDFVRSERYRNIADKALTSGWNWSSKFKNSWFKYNEVFVNHEIWIDNDSSLGLKYDFAIAKDLKGVGMWALGYDGARNEYWNMLDKKFGSGAVAVETEKDIENIFYLSQNYPNPFNPTTTISYSIPNAVGANFASTTNIKLSVYDILGNEVSTLVDDFQKAGSYSVRFNASDLSSGIYIYKLQTGAKILTRKMIVLK